MKKSVIALGLVSCAAFSGVAVAAYPTLEEVREFTKDQGNVMVCGQMGVATYYNELGDPEDKHLFNRLKVIFSERVEKMTEEQWTVCEDNFTIGYVSAMRENEGGKK
ncbi:MAG: hypothetical protein ACRDCE_15550 [Cetobacterium sp.]|uniref:hypothetical protein n=1 Tax=Cetobacterium sp. TaxID=2071632 RepID=UPI003EE53C48